MIASRFMDILNHAALVALDQTRAAQHEEALAAWREGPFAQWHRADHKARAEQKESPPRPTPPAPPVLVQNAVIGIASKHGITADDLVRFARKTEVRTAYPKGALERARADLGDELCAALLTITWPELPPAPKPASEIPAPEMERAPPPPPVAPLEAHTDEAPRGHGVVSNDAPVPPVEASPAQTTSEAPSRDTP